jgi:hypothetical protein
MSMITIALRTLAVFTAVGWMLPLGAQQPNLPSNAPGNKPVPVITFDFAFPGTQPEHYTVSVNSSGHATYRSDDTAAVGRGSGAEEPYTEEFTISRGSRDQIFQLAEQAHYFRGDFEYGKGRIANMGAKTLAYSDGLAANGIGYQTAYNYSQNPAIQQLTTIFQGISNTLELGRRLAYLHRFDKLGLEAELQQAEETAQAGNLLELQVIAPILRAVADDYGVMHIARERAQRLLKRVQAAQQ